MNESEFGLLYEQTLMQIEDVIEDAELDLDCESVNDILTISFEDGSSIIITKQTAALQLWIAAKSGGFYFDYDELEKAFICNANQQHLAPFLANLCLEQGGVSLEF